MIRNVIFLSMLLLGQWLMAQGVERSRIRPHSTTSVCTDFENGIDGYRGFYGPNKPSSQANYCVSDILLNSSNEIPINDLGNLSQTNGVGRVFASQNDPNIPISVVSSGNSAIRINQDLGNGQDRDEAHLVRYFTATSNVTSISFRMAYVVKALGLDFDADIDGSHPDPDNDAYIRASINVGTLNTDITTPDSKFCLRANIYDCQFMEGSPGSGAYYTDWQTVTLAFDPTPYLGQTLRLDIEVADCAVIEDYSYAYIDDICTNIPESDTSILCCYDEEDAPIFNIEASCVGFGCTLCEDPSDPINFRVKDLIGQTVDNTTYPGIALLWTNTATGQTGTGTTFQAFSNQEVTVALSLGGCAITLDTIAQCGAAANCYNEGNFPIVSDNDLVPNYDDWIAGGIEIDNDDNILSIGKWSSTSIWPNSSVSEALIKFDQNGNELWSKDLYFSKWANIEVDDDNDIYIAQHLTDRRLLKINPNGNTLWNIEFDIDLGSKFVLDKSTGTTFYINDVSHLNNDFIIKAVNSNGQFLPNLESILNADKVEILGFYNSKLRMAVYHNQTIDFLSNNISVSAPFGSNWITYVEMDSVGNILTTQQIQNYDQSSIIDIQQNPFNNRIYLFENNSLSSLNTSGQLVWQINLNTESNLQLSNPFWHSDYIFSNINGSVYFYRTLEGNHTSSVLLEVNTFGSVNSNIISDFTSEEGGFTSFGNFAALGNNCLYTFGYLHFGQNSSIVLEDGLTITNPSNSSNYQSIIFKHTDDLSVLPALGSRDLQTKTQSITRAIAYPNPFTGQFTIATKDGQDTIEKVELYDAHGHKLQSLAYTKDLKLQLEGKHPGLYFAKVYFTDGTVETVRLLKE